MRTAPRILVARPWLVYLALALVAFPVLEMIVKGTSALQFAHDVFDDDVPRLYSIATDWRTFGPSLWNTHLTSGNALLAQFALPPVAPDVLLTAVVDPFLAYATNTALIAFAAGFAMHLFLRDSLRLRAGACFVGGILAGLAFWHYVLGYAIPLLPAVLWSTDRLLATRRRGRDVVIAVLLIAFLFASSLSQIVLIDAVVALAWVLVSRDAGRSRRERVATLVGTWAVGAMLLAPVLLTQLVALPTSQRTIWDLPALTPLGQALRQATTLYTRILFGVPMGNGIGGSADIYGSWFLGAIGLPLLVIGCLTPRRSSRTRLLLVLLVVIPVIDIVAVLARTFQESLGPISSFQFVRVRHLMPFVLIANAAIGVDVLQRPNPIRFLGRTRTALAAIGMVFVGIAVLAQAVVALRRFRSGSGGEVGHAGWELSLLALGFGAIAAVILAAPPAIAFLRSRRAEVVRVGSILVIALCVGLGAERLVYTRGERLIDGQLGTWADRVAPTAAQLFIADQKSGGRVLSLGEDANRAMAARLDAVDGYQTIYPLRYHELFGELTAPTLLKDPVRYVYFHSWGNRAYAFGPAVNRALLDLMGVRWIYAVGDSMADDTGAIDPSLGRTTPAFSGGNVTVLENHDAFPRSFIVGEIRSVPDRATLLKDLGAADTATLRSTAWVAAPDLAGSGIPGVDVPARAVGADDRADIVDDTPDRVVIDASAAGPGVVVLTDAIAAGWEADVDGRPEPILPVDGALRGVAIPAGAHTVTFAYRPLATYVGIGFAAVGLILLVAGSRSVGRRRPSAGRRRRTS